MALAMAGPFRVSRRLVEWGLLALVILAVVLVFLRQARWVQGQAELAALESTLGVLRLALVFEQLHVETKSAQVNVAPVPRNPFLLLQRPPANYQGEMIAAKAVDLQPGSWVYDPECGCVGYLPIDSQWLASQSGAASIWYRMSGAARVAQLVAIEAYSWQGKALK